MIEPCTTNLFVQSFPLINPVITGCYIQLLEFAQTRKKMIGSIPIFVTYCRPSDHWIPLIFPYMSVHCGRVYLKVLFESYYCDDRSYHGSFPGKHYNMYIYIYIIYLYINNNSCVIIIHNIDLYYIPYLFVIYNHIQICINIAVLVSPLSVVKH